MIRRYPSVNNDRDTFIAPKRGADIKYGLFGSIIAVYRLAFDSEVDADTDGRLSFPVNTPEEASELLLKLRNEEIDDYILQRPKYQRVYFVSNGVI
jgi:DNA primase catalytic subunit